MTDNNSIGYYDEGDYNYVDYWHGRDYEHHSEVLAIRKLLGKRHYEVAMDYGGGYGRLADTILPYVDKLILSDPSIKQLDIGKSRFAKNNKVEFMQLKKSGEIPSEDSSLDLLLMIRVTHHIHDLAPTFTEIRRVLKPGGQAIIEVASSAHFKNRIKHLAKFQKMPVKPVEIGSVANGKKEKTPFVNHNPNTVALTLETVGLHVVKQLSVSNFRSTTLKKLLGTKALLGVEKLSQQTLAPIHWGPSIFILVNKD